MWEQVRTNFIKALADQRIDKWLVEESKNSAEVSTKFRQLNDIVAFAKFLDEKVKEEQAVATGWNGGSIFVGFYAGRGV
jgi:hypothetical protein